jgi:hypothetical protein
MIPFIFVHNQTVEFVYTHRAVILRTIMRSGFICSYSLARQQRMPFLQHRQFQIRPVCALKSGSVTSMNHGQCGKPGWENHGGYVILVAVRRPLGEAIDGCSKQGQSAAVAAQPLFIACTLGPPSSGAESLMVTTGACLGLLHPKLELS